MIKVTNVHKNFKEVKAVNGIDLHIQPGQYVALLGPNGAGKTTLVEMIEGLQHPDVGEIQIMEKRWKDHQEELHRIIGLSLQETRFVDKLSVLETLRLFASFYGLGGKRIQEILDLVNLEEKKKSFVVNLSGGQRQRLALGIALLNEPEILLLDEPTTGLDPTARREIWDILKSLKSSNNTTMILTTHYMDEAAYLCDKIVIMDSGKILAEGTLEQLLSKHKKGEVISFETNGPIPPDQLPGGDKIIKSVIEPVANKGEIIIEDLVSYLPSFLEFIKNQNLVLTSLECRKMTLDDLFIAMTGRHLNQ
ncbi:ABC transporter ATP-binding protein [Fulvivirgaceae bacterium BMA12]|uniref:ABC transporter ATP-binding protein n=1 Tax=Agaribacillus aureus TaxID=3051825 RepID=A0ABT8L5H7_9BACT|nr:ABC transporter ATP-binding protein [Fulvivirgaceae bacterium BMA12]